MAKEMLFDTEASLQLVICRSLLLYLPGYPCRLTSGCLALRTIPKLLTPPGACSQPSDILSYAGQASAITASAAIGDRQSLLVLIGELSM